jgi:hypothetical protein
VSGHGHRAALPAGGHSRPEYLAGDEKGALAVRHYNREGRVREYDFTALPVPAAMQASLAALFAARCTPDRWSVHATSRRTWIYLRQFAGLLDGLRQQPRDLDELTPELIRLWRESLSEAGGAAAFKTVSGLLRGRRTGPALQGTPEHSPVLQRGRVRPDHGDRPAPVPGRLAAHQRERRPPAALAGGRLCHRGEVKDAPSLDHCAPGCGNIARIMRATSSCLA